MDGNQLHNILEKHIQLYLDKHPTTKCSDIPSKVFTNAQQEAVSFENGNSSIDSEVVDHIKFVSIQPGINLISVQYLKDQKLEVMGYKKTGLVGGPSHFLIVQDQQGSEHLINPDYVEPF